MTECAITPVTRHIYLLCCRPKLGKTWVTHLYTVGSPWDWKMWIHCYLFCVWWIRMHIYSSVKSTYVWSRLRCLIWGIMYKFSYLLTYSLSCCCCNAEAYMRVCSVQYTGMWCQLTANRLSSSTCWGHGGRLIPPCFLGI